MTRRITAAVVALVVATMLVAGVGTLIATRVAGRARELKDLESRADAIAELVPNLGRAGAGGADVPGGTGSTADDTALATARAKVIDVLGLSGVTQLRIDRVGNLVGTPPAWIRSGDLDVAALRNGTTLSGSRGNRLWAAAARTNPNGSATVAIVTRTREAIIGPALRWLALSAIVTLVLGLAVGALLARRLGRPLRAAVDVTRRIADGDLSARLPEASRGPDARGPGPTTSAQTPAHIRAGSDPSGRILHGEPPGSDELDQLAHAINAMAAQLERSRGLEHQFLMSVSHDLRTPLTSIRGYAEAIADGVADPTTSAEVIVGESRRLDRLVADLLDLAKLDARQFGFRLSTTVVGPVLAAAVARIGPEAQHAGVTVHVEEAPDAAAASVVVDPDRLAQAIGNLTSNCLKFARSAVGIRTRLASDPSGAHAASAAGVAVDVADDGPGIAADDLPHVFERLYQARNQVEARESGSGLGLAIVKELVEGMGGTIAVASVVGSGTTFTLWIPRTG